MPTSGSNSSPDISHDTGGSDQRESTGTELHIRALATPFKRTSLQQLEDGDLLIKGVPMLAEGTWTDSAIGTPLFYPSKTLAEYAANWQDKSGWNRHSGGVPRRGTDKVGEADNIRFENGAVTADLRVYGFTQNGRDMQEMIKRKLISFVSVEHGGDERMNPATRQMEASSLVFYGFAFVNRGACKVCKMNEEKETPKENAFDFSECVDAKMKEGHDKATAIEMCKAIAAKRENSTEDTMDTKELEDKIAALTKELEAVKAKPVEVRTEIPKELSEQMAAMAARIKELEKAPVPPVTAPVVETRELGKVDTPVVIFDKKSGTVKGA